MTRIEDYALIGDLQTAALVSRGGSIDWCCFPRFDSGACFAALLGGPEHGRWLLAPTEAASSTRRYRSETLILETVFETESGSVRVIDLMPPRGSAPDIVRIVEGLHGTVAMHSELVIRFDFGRILPWVRRIDHARVAIAGPDALCLRTPAPVRGEQMKTLSDFTVSAGQRVPFVLTWFPSHEELPAAVDPEQALTDAEHYWHEWASSGEHAGGYHREVHESLLVLKALTYAPTGGIVAAPTTSLPELIGGVRNWDYRYTWIRDGAFSIYALLRLGFIEEAGAFMSWLSDRYRESAGRGDGPLQIMYGIDGRPDLEEIELSHLEGYRGSRPVRVGNGAATQLQLDIYGELIDSVYLYNKYGHPISYDDWKALSGVVDWLCDNWDRADEGIWEVRGGRQHFTYSRLMSWVAIERAIRMARQRGLPGDLVRWLGVRDQITHQIMERGWHPERKAFVQHYDTDVLDASVLLMPLTKFIAPRDPRWLSTLDAIGDELVSDSLVYRYNVEAAPDGLRGEEGTFSICSFWYVEALTRAGRVDEARLAFEKMLTYANHLGLYSEEIGPSGEALGNFPQAFTHLALISAATNLDQQLG